MQQQERRLMGPYFCGEDGGATPRQKADTQDCYLKRAAR